MFHMLGLRGACCGALITPFLHEIPGQRQIVLSKLRDYITRGGTYGVGGLSFMLRSTNDATFGVHQASQWQLMLFGFQQFPLN